MRHSIAHKSSSFILIYLSSFPTTTSSISSSLFLQATLREKMFFHKPLLLAASLSLFLCLFPFASAGRIDRGQLRFSKRSPAPSSEKKDSALGMLHAKWSANNKRAPPSIPPTGYTTITSTLKILPEDAMPLGECYCPRTLDEESQGISGACAEKFVASAKKTVKCTFLTSTEATCLEEGGKANLSDGDTAWWQMAFCKRCQDAGGISNALYPSCAAQMPQD